MTDYWLLFNTSMCQWIVQVCYMHKHLNDMKKREYHWDFCEYDRYSIEVTSHKDKFKCKLLRSHNLLAIIDFDTPIDFCKKLWCHLHPDIARFNRLILDRVGLKMC